MVQLTDDINSTNPHFLFNSLVRQLRWQLYPQLSWSWGLKCIVLAIRGKRMVPQLKSISGTMSFSVSCSTTLDHFCKNEPRLSLSLNSTGKLAKEAYTMETRQINTLFLVKAICRGMWEEEKKCMKCINISATKSTQSPQGTFWAVLSTILCSEHDFSFLLFCYHYF